MEHNIGRNGAAFDMSKQLQPQLPWHAEYERVYDASGELIAEVFKTHAINLVAASPDILEALVVLVGTIAHTHDDVCNSYCKIKLAENAIRKARGLAPDAATPNQAITMSAFTPSPPPLGLPQSQPRAEIDFTCRVCGKQCDIAPDPPERAVCEDCCPDHQYEYEQMLRRKICKDCGKPQPEDWY